MLQERLRQVRKTAGYRIRHNWSNNPKAEIWGLGASTMWDPIQKQFEVLTLTALEHHQIPRSVFDFSQHIGDLGDTYFFTGVTDLGMALIAPNTPRWIRRTASVAVGTLAGFIAEVPKLNALASHVVPHSFLGTPDFPADIWAALAGPAVWLVVNIWANRPKQEESNR